ncbi:MAG: radical SAM family heme chaperone HemW [Elusimicrobiota bacterium]|nr:radical SAM family heme chaperone HemW [Elusimicrobiota bacterium]
MTGLYAHIPFCSVKCFYCDFAAFSGQDKLADRYLVALEAEAAYHPAVTPDTLYIGGGTPSELTATQIGELYGRLRRAYPGARFSESTFEGNPESLDEEKLAVLAREGVTRLSIGLQTADDGLLKAIGRRHTAADFAAAFLAARAAGIPALSVDLMFGLPGQTLDSLRATLDFVLALAPEHISLYGLQIEDRTLFAKRGVQEDGDLSREMFDLSMRSLAAAGLEQYEISNYARPGHRSAHNVNYWKRGEYIGLGCSAASYYDGRRQANEHRLHAYLDAVEAGRRPLAEDESPRGLEAIGEEAFLGLRLLEGFVPSEALRKEFAGEWAMLKSRGLVSEEGPLWRLSAEGVFLANDAFQEFVPPFDREEAPV